ncbi:MAG TPA: FG-GAP and VCBS repeat-containing protein [Thermoanaerobaculia bacterium]|nr:FG-GAP and VCBS repeat-containing protein [Thermoanaerobaculia bacterium]
MFEKKFLIALCAAALAAPTAALAQNPPQTATAAPAQATAVPDGGVPHYIRAETPEQRRERLGTPDDPGPNPDPSQHYWRFGQSYHIERFDRRFENYEGCEPGFVRPYGFLNVQKEIYQINDKWVWVWMDDPSPDASVPAPPPPRYTDAQLRHFENMRPEFSAVQPKSAAETIRFEESSQGLPTSGSWRNSPAVADMNGDGCPDIIAPPERKGGQVPAIFLGDCKGHWTLWRAVRWPVAVDYGNVAAADFNRDGHMDLVFGVHQVGPIVLLGDGKGGFTVSNKGMEHAFATRRVMAVDVDHDGDPDVVVLNEGVSPVFRGAAAKIRVYLNRNKGTSWQAVDIAGPDRPVSGDWMTMGNFNGDRYPDFVAATIYQNSNDIIFLSKGAKQWKPLGAAPSLIPALGLYYANTTGKFSSKTRDDAVVSYQRVWPGDLDQATMPSPPLTNLVGIDRISFHGKTPVRTPVVRFTGTRPILGLASGDFDGDGKPDLVYTRFDPRELVILLGDRKGGFAQAKVEGVKLDPNTNYDITVADVNGDGRPDLIVMYESAGASTTFGQRDGSIAVFLNRGAAPAARAAK